MNKWQNFNSSSSDDCFIFIIYTYYMDGYYYLELIKTSFKFRNAGSVWMCRTPWIPSLISSNQKLGTQKSRLWNMICTRSYPTTCHRFNWAWNVGKMSRRHQQSWSNQGLGMHLGKMLVLYYILAKKVWIFKKIF